MRRYWGWVILVLAAVGGYVVYKRYLQQKVAGFFRGVASPFSASGSTGGASTPSERVPGSTGSDADGTGIVEVT